MIPVGTRVYFAKEPADLRRSFDGLAATAMSQLGRDAGEGGLFVFLNRRGNQVRVLFRDTQGWCLLSKRLDSGRFRSPPVKEGEVCWQTDTSELLRFLDSVIASKGRQKRNACHAPLVRRKLTVVQS